MGLVRVWNDNTYPFRQNFKGEDIMIPAKKFIMMDEEDAVSFRGKYSPPILDGANNCLPHSYKMIRIEHNSEPEALVSSKFRCHADGAEFDTQEELDEYVKANHADKLGKAEKAGNADPEKKLEDYDDVSTGLPKKGGRGRA